MQCLPIGYLLIQFCFVLLYGVKARADICGLFFVWHVLYGGFLPDDSTLILLGKLGNACYLGKAPMRIWCYCGWHGLSNIVSPVDAGSVGISNGICSWASLSDIRHPVISPPKIYPPVHGNCAAMLIATSQLPASWLPSKEAVDLPVATPVDSPVLAHSHFSLYERFYTFIFVCFCVFFSFLVAVFSVSLWFCCFLLSWFMSLPCHFFLL